MERILLKGGTVIDPASFFIAKKDVFIADGAVVSIEDSIDAGADRVIDVSGKTVTCGLVDMHVHSRDPGQEYKEDIISAAYSAAAGGVTCAAMMPNTVPCVDSPEILRNIIKKAESAKVNMLQIASITKGMEGKELNDLKALADLGAVGFSEDGKSVMDSGILKEAMYTAKELGLPIISHCEDPALVKGGVMNDDENAIRLGLPGICNESEWAIVKRDIELAKETGCSLHICHVSTKKSVDIIRDARSDGVDVTAETCPHYLSLTSDDIPGDDGNYKMNPPLRSAEDREALIRGVKDGVIGIISTDHAPHSAQEKAGGFLCSPFGIIGMETSVPVVYTTLVKTGRLSLMEMLRAMSTSPAKRLGIDAGRMAPGTKDVVVFDFDRPYNIDSGSFFSKSSNTPFDGMRVFGKAMITICGGRIVFERD